MTIRQNWWSHEAWARPGFAVEAPPMAQPQTATVLLVGLQPQAWRIPFLPAQAAYVGSATPFPNSPAYDERVRKIAAERGGAVYAMFPGAQEGAPCQCPLIPYVEKADDQNRALIATAETQLRIGGWQSVPGLRLPVDDSHVGIPGWQLKPGSCTVHASHIGSGNYPFHWCEVTPLP